MPSKENLETLLASLENTDNFPLWLYFVTRSIKEGVKKTAKVVDKYDFNLNKIDLSEEMQSFFKDVLKEQLKKVLSKKDIEMVEYTVIGDDLSNKIYTYALNNALSFSSVINHQLSGDNVPSVTSLKEIQDGLWAYCIKASIDGKEFYSFRKTSKGKVATDQPTNKMQKISSWFDSSDSELKPIIGEIINFDDRIDCMYLDDLFYVFKKGVFEQILGLEEEFIESAKQVIEILHASDLIIGLELIEQDLGKNKSLLKSLSSIAKKNNHEGFDKSEIEKMKSVLSKIEGQELKMTEEGKIMLEDESDVKYFIKLLNDYYKEGMVTGKYYGSHSGEVLTIATK